MAHTLPPILRPSDQSTQQRSSEARPGVQGIRVKVNEKKRDESILELSFWMKEILTRGEGDWGSEGKLANAALDEANVMQALAESDDFEIVANEATNKKEFTDKITGG
ncbi:hypothetical protein AAF712_015397 [Marasmius tenuissimus]|uniref:Uncharacterized protein n=1 Tax=Marasmius tenuissimus TaxID=585030 RepID=A0ABR2ZAH6_9AGAR